MSTIKFIAYGKQSSGYQKFPIRDKDNNTYYPVRSPKDLIIGQYAYLGKRINSHHGLPAKWELWRIQLESDKYGHPKYWYGKNRYLFL